MSHGPRGGSDTAADTRLAVTLEGFCLSRASPPLNHHRRLSSGGENGVFCRVGAWHSRGWCDGERFALVPISCSRIVHHAVSALELFIQEFARRLCSGCRFALTSDHAFVVQEFSGGRQRFTCSADTIFIQGPAATGAFQGFPFTA